MRLRILGRKQGMSQIFDDKGNRVPVTVVTVGPCTVTQVKTPEKDGYAGVQIAFEEAKPSRVGKGRAGHFKKAGVTPKKHLIEFRVEPTELSSFKVGQILTSEVFQPGDIVDVTGMSKGLGFQGVVRRHGMPGLRATHGTHENYRTAGSVGMRTHPARIIPGKRMAGQKGNERVTVQNLKVLEISKDDHVIVLKGCLPGHRRAVVEISHAMKRTAPKGRVAAPAEKEAPEAAPAPAQ